MPPEMDIGLGAGSAGTASGLEARCRGVEIDDLQSSNAREQQLRAELEEKRRKIGIVRHPLLTLR